MRIAYTNLLDDLAASAMTALTENSLFPLTNVQDQRLSTVFRSTACTSQTIILDLGATTATTIVALLGHNLSTSATVTVDAAATNSWPGATVCSVTYNAGAMLTFYASTGYRWWRLSINDASNADGYLQIGRVWLGTYMTVDPSSLLSFKVTRLRSDNVWHGKGRQKFASPGSGWRRFELAFPRSNDSMIAQIEDFQDAVGLHSSFIFCNFDSIRGYSLVEPCYCSLSQDISFAHDTNLNWTYDLVMEEEL